MAPTRAEQIMGAGAPPAAGKVDGSLNNVHHHGWTHVVRMYMFATFMMYNVYCCLPVVLPVCMSVCICLSVCVRLLAVCLSVWLSVCCSTNTPRAPQGAPKAAQKGPCRDVLAPCWAYVPWAWGRPPPSIIHGIHDPSHGAHIIWRSWGWEPYGNAH